MRHTFVAFPLALALAFTACGDEGPAAPDRAADVRRAKAAVVQQGDLPPGWEAAPVGEDDVSADEQVDRQLNACLGVTHEQAELPKASSSFALEDQSAESTVEYAASVADAKASFADVDSPELEGCLEKVFRAVLAEQASAQGVALGPVEVDARPAPDVGDDVVALRASTTSNADGVEVPLLFDLTVTRAGRALVTLFASGVEAAVADELQHRLVAAMVSRA